MNNKDRLLSILQKIQLNKYKCFINHDEAGLGLALNAGSIKEIKDTENEIVVSFDGIFEKPFSRAYPVTLTLKDDISFVNEVITKNKHYVEFATINKTNTKITLKE